MPNDAAHVTWQSGPSDPPTLLDGPGTSVETMVSAPPSRVWELVSDIEVPVRFSRELVAARWSDDSPEPGVGAVFVGSNRNSRIGEWDIPCHVVEWDRPRSFAWATMDPSAPGATWRYEIDDVEGASRLRHSVVIGPGPSGLQAYIDGDPSNAGAAIASRLANLRTNMQSVVDGIAALAEA